MFNIGNFLSFIIYLVFAGLVVYAIYWFIGILNLPQPIKNIILAIVAIVALIWLVNILFGLNISFR